LHGATPLLLLLRGEALEGLSAVQGAGPLLRIHAIESIQLIEFALLGFGIKFAKAGFVLQGAPLVSRGEILVVLHPLLEVPWALRSRGRDPGSRRGANFRSGLYRPFLGSRLCTGLRPLGGAVLAKAAGERRLGSAQQDKCRAEKKPG
jgi:hypothetical protein